MPIELKVPSVGESITEVQIGDWLKAVGDQVQRDEVVVMIETDKVTVELPAPVSGTLAEIKIQKGQSANVGDVIGYLEEGTVVSAVAPQKAPVSTNDGKSAMPPSMRSLPPEHAPRTATQPSPAPRASELEP